MSSSPSAAPAPQRRGRHRARPERPGARRAGLLGAAATLAAGGVAVTHQLGQGSAEHVVAEAPAPSGPVELPRVMGAPQGAYARIVKAARADRAKRPAAATWTRPVDQYVLSSPFGARWGSVHHGLDFECPIGTPVKSVSAGRVSDVRIGARVYGVYVDIVHTDGSLTRYGHLSKVLVAKGATVTTGQVIALSGNEGRSTGPHLHLEVHPHGDPNLRDAADPVVELRRRGLTV